MGNFKFSPAPQLRGADQPLVACRLSWHPPYSAAEVEQFDGTWKVKTCPRCAWEAIHTGAIGSAEQLQAASDFAADELNRRLIATGIQPRFRGCTFENYRLTEGNPEEAKALVACRGYAEQFDVNLREGRGLLLVGNLGTGKTHLASAIVQHVVREHDAWAVITTAAEICRVIRGSYGKGAGYTETDALDELASTDLLVIDEIGVQSGSDFAPGVMNDVIDRRYQRMRPTILISNRPAAELSQFIGDRALDRMRQGGKAIGFSWQSARAAL